MLDDERLIDRRLLAVGIGLAVLNVLLWAGLVIGLFFAFKAIF